jgi:hypothetical protein
MFEPRPASSLIRATRKMTRALAARPRHDPDRHHDLRTFFLDPAGELRDVRRASVSRELVDVAPEPGTELVAGDAGDFRRLDAHAVRRFVVLGGRWRECREDAEEEQGQGSHGGPTGQAAGHSTSC